MSEFTCNGCDNQWGGLRTAHCAACHETFTALTGFDKHRVRGQCVTPAGVGLVDAERKYPCWGMPGERVFGEL